MKTPLSLMDSCDIKRDKKIIFAQRYFRSFRQAQPSGNANISISTSLLLSLPVWFVNLELSFSAVNVKNTPQRKHINFYTISI